jgi:hypothetical protein
MGWPAFYSLCPEDRFRSTPRGKLNLSNALSRAGFAGFSQTMQRQTPRVRAEIPGIRLRKAVSGAGSAEELHGGVAPFFGTRL